MINAVITKLSVREAIRTDNVIHRLSQLVFMQNRLVVSFYGVETAVIWRILHIGLQRT